MYITWVSVGVWDSLALLVACLQVDEFAEGARLFHIRLPAGVLIRRAGEGAPVRAPVRVRVPKHPHPPNFYTQWY